MTISIALIYTRIMIYFLLSFLMFLHSTILIRRRYVELTISMLLFFLGVNLLFRTMGLVDIGNFLADITITPILFLLSCQVIYSMVIKRGEL
jgi:hypothetical protein